MPLNQLCISCHTDKSAEAKENKGLFAHDPVSEGSCTPCHHPHQARYRFMLVKPGKDLCFQCHEEEDIMENKAHAEAGSCLECHNPHFGNDPIRLVKKYREKFLGD
jgi:predicted CXXCH cytochrome family protein